MRTPNSLFLLGGSILLAACTSSNTADVSSSEISDTTSESAEIAGSFASESPSAITVDQVASPSGASDLVGMPREIKLPADTRAELVTALEAIAADPKACVSGTASITPAGNQTADCASIGTNGSYPGGLTLAFSNCALVNGGILNGTASVAVTRALSSGATCGPDASIDVTHDITMTNLSYTTPSKYVLSYLTFAADVTSTHAINALPSLVTLTSLSGERTVADPSGTLILDHKFSGAGTVALAPGSRTVNGMFTIDHELLKVTASIAVTNVERVETCCKPIAGSVDITLSSATSKLVSGDFSYGPACGDVDLNGKPLVVAECL
jgi:hypothetical protein